MGDKQYIGCNMRREHCYTKIFEQTAFFHELKIFSRSNAMLVLTVYFLDARLVERAVFRCFAG